MSPDHARVAIFDEARYRASVLAVFLIKGRQHRVIGMATTTETAEEMIAKIEDLDVALFGGNLDPDGSLAGKVREKFPKVKVISISHLSTSDLQQDWLKPSSLNSLCEIAEEVTKA